MLPGYDVIHISKWHHRIVSICKIWQQCSYDFLSIFDNTVHYFNEHLGNIFVENAKMHYFLMKNGIIYKFCNTVCILQVKWQQCIDIKSQSYDFCFFILCKNISFEKVEKEMRSIFI